VAGKQDIENIFEEGPPKKGEKLRFGMVLMRHLDRLSNIVVNKTWLAQYNEYWRGTQYLSSMLNPYWDAKFEKDRKKILSTLKEKQEKIGCSRILRARKEPNLYTHTANRLVKACMRLIERQGLIPKETVLPIEEKEK